MNLLIYFLTPLGLTIIIEVIVAFLCKIRTIRDLFVVVLAQILTNPLVNLGVLYISFLNNAYYYGLYLFIIETLVLLTETFVYKNCLNDNKTSAFRIATYGNLASFGIGIVYVLITEIIKQY